MDAENSQLEAMLAGYGPRGRTILLEMLHDAQAIYGGWLPRPAIERIAEFLEIPVADVYGVTAVLRDVPHGAGRPPGDPCLPGRAVRGGRRSRR